LIKYGLAVGIGYHFGQPRCGRSGNSPGVGIK
jgi:hypothetical protein